MNLSALGRLGKAAGIGGISVGAAILLLNALIGTIPGLAADQQAEIVKPLATLSFSIGVIGIIAWSASRGTAARHRAAPSVVADRRDIVGRNNKITASDDTKIEPVEPWPRKRK